MGDRELLEQILNKLSELEHGQQKMQKDIDNIQSKVDGIEVKMNQIDSKVNQIETKVNQIDSKVDRNYDKTVEFYAMQQEHNTEVSDTLELVSGKLEIYADQTARNTLALKRYK